MNKLDNYWDFLVDNGVATEDELRLVTSINGYDQKTLDDILYVRTGYRSKEQYCDAEGIDCDLEESKVTPSNLTNKILEGADISKVIGMSSMESTVLRDKDITGCDDEEELVLYIVNNGNLYRSRTKAIIDNLQKKFRKGAYDPEQAIKAFMYLVDDGVRKYDKEFVSGQGKLFLDKKTREEIAKQLRDYYEEQITESWKVNEAVGYNYRGYYVEEIPFGCEVWFHGKKLQEFATATEAEEFIDEVIKES